MSAYSGHEKYTFISYAHRDKELALPIIDGLISRGMRVWYDEGIEVGTEWAEYIEERILGCECFILLLSRASVESINCREEFALARETEKKILICYIEELPPSELKHGLRLRVPTYQCIFLTRHPSVVNLLDEICRARIVDGCILASATEPTPVTVGDEPKHADTESIMERDARLAALQHVEAAPAPSIPEPAPSIPEPEPSISEPAPSISEPAPSIPEPAPSIPEPAPSIPEPAPSVTPAMPVGAGSIKYSEGLKISPLGLLSGIGSCNDEVIVVPSSVHSIERGAFKNCKRIREIILPEGVKVIPDKVFFGCTRLERVTVSKYLKHIGVSAFEGCVKLAAINLPADVQFIKDRAFMNCRELFLGWTPANLYELGERAFYNCHLVQGMFSTNIRSIGHLALGKRESTHANIVHYSGTLEQWGQVKRNGKIMSCRVQYVKCSDNKEYIFE